MEVDRAINVIAALADGIDPTTGEAFPMNSPYQDPDTIRALYLAVQGLQKMKSREERAKSLPTMAGKAWSEDEDQALIESFKAGVIINDLAAEHGRTIGAIQSRLVKLGCLSHDMVMFANKKL